jgi:hypothetical protein
MVEMVELVELVELVEMVEIVEIVEMVDAVFVQFLIKNKRNTKIKNLINFFKISKLSMLTASLLSHACIFIVIRSKVGEVLKFQRILGVCTVKKSMYCTLLFCYHEIVVVLVQVSKHFVTEKYHWMKSMDVHDGKQ